MLKKFTLSLIILLLLIGGFGYLLIFTQMGKFFTKPLLQDYISTHFSRDLELQDFQMGFGDVGAQLLYKDLLKIQVKGSYSLLSKSFDLTIKGQSYSIKKNFTLSGKIEGTTKDFLAKFSSNIASSQSSLIAQFKDSRTEHYYFQGMGLHLEELLPILSTQVPQLKGIADIIIDKRKNTEGSLSLDLRGVCFLSKPTHFSFLNQLLKQSFDGKIEGKLREDFDILAQGVLRSSAYEAQLENLNLTKDHLKLDYKLNLPQISAINPKAKIHFPVEGSGSIRKNQKEGFVLDFDTQSFGGQIHARVQNQDLKAEFEQSDLEKLLVFMKIPQNFNGRVDGTLDYSLPTGKGKFDGVLSDFSIKTNVFFDLIARYTHFKISSEQFDDAPLHIDFDKRHATLKNLSLQSQNMGFRSDALELDLEKMTLDAPLTMRIKNSSIGFHLQGNINNLYTKFELRDILRLDRK
ncbi:hypothetical protein [Helicobacter mustelae]|uniref:Putative inner membrane protein n=1 Tax=Helicobacter mustelae (strain ATCC 43772 / CCUG 25715 / CIP 103759 / LMG 18044 / NCTC 12198 / R85-136P) TaxID=679897 RepID=D3UFW8_HELM1|nr:hypothetical protein [Helicobacter mustelae]CBG39389.1 Putative inner membrane protein [Helicobacter mustelae 12198]SQH70902.1 outer membrane protein [Helicobacter mustelae]